MRARYVQVVSRLMSIVKYKPNKQIGASSSMPLKNRDRLRGCSFVKKRDYETYITALKKALHTRPMKFDENLRDPWFFKNHSPPLIQISFLSCFGNHTLGGSPRLSSDLLWCYRFTLSRYPAISSHWPDTATISCPSAEFGCGKYLIVPFWYTSTAYQASLVSPWVSSETSAKPPRHSHHSLDCNWV